MEEGRFPGSSTELHMLAARSDEEGEGTTYSVFARFRRTKLTLARRITSIDAAVVYAQRMRGERFHDPESVFIVDDRCGSVVDERRIEPALTEASAPDSCAVLACSVARTGLDRLQRALVLARAAQQRYVAAHASWLSNVDELNDDAVGGRARISASAAAVVEQGSRALQAMESMLDTL